MATPNITREIFDGNLTRVTPQGVTNRRVVILGTASDGPMYTPVRVTSAGAAEDLFGSISDGDLVRGCKEALDAQAGFPKNPNVWGMRIGGIIASRATKSIFDAQGTPVSLLELEAVNEGSIYNDIYMSVDTNLSEISIWNPKLKVFNKYKFNWTNPNDTDADVHSLQELVDKINADRNLSSILFAATPSLEGVAEIGVQAGVGGSSFVTENGQQKVTLDLAQVTAGGTVNGDGSIAESAQLVNGSGTNDAVPGNTISQRFRDIQSAYSIYASEVLKIDKGAVQHVIEDGFLLNNNTQQQGVLPILDMTENSDHIITAGSGGSEVCYSVDAEGCLWEANDNGTFEEIQNGVAITGANAQVQLKFDTGNTNITEFYDNAGTGPYVDPYDHALQPAGTGSGQNADSPVKIEVQISGGGWVQVVDQGGTGFNPQWSSGVVTFDIPADATYGEGGAVLYNGTNGPMESGSVQFRVSFTTMPVALTQVQTLDSLGGAMNKYFIQGNTITLGAAHSNKVSLLFRHSVVKYYNPAEMTIAQNPDGSGVISIYDNFNKDKSAAIDYSTNAAIFGLKMRYYGDVTDLSGSYYLNGGTNGTDMTNAQLYDDLDTAYDHFSEDFFDIMAVMGATFDAQKTAPNASGNYVSGPAGFHTQMSDFLNAFNGEMIGVMGFEPIEGSGVGGRILKSDVDARVASVPSNLESFHQPFMFAADIEAIFSAGGTRYGANAAAAIAGLIAAIPVEEALYRFTVPGMLGMVWRYSEVDKLTGRKQIDLMSDARICTGQIDNGVKLTEARTLAIDGSDFENLMTVLILQQALDLCRNVAKNYIGKVSSAALLQAFQSELNTALGEALVPKALRGFNAPITMEAGERVVGKLTIPLTLSPQFEIRDVHYTVTLTADDIVAA